MVYRFFIRLITFSLISFLVSLALLLYIGEFTLVVFAETFIYGLCLIYSIRLLYNNVLKGIFKELGRYTILSMIFQSWAGFACCIALLICMAAFAFIAVIPIGAAQALLELVQAIRLDGE